MYEQQYSMRSKKSSLPRMELVCTQWVSDVLYGIIQTMGVIIGGVYAPITRGPWATSLTWENTREEDLNFVNVFSLLRNYYWPHGFREEHFKILSMFFCYFVIIFPWKRGGPSFEQTWIPFTLGCFLPNLVEIGPVSLEKIHLLIGWSYTPYRQYFSHVMADILRTSR